MFGVGMGEVWVLVAVAFLLALTWRMWRARWVRVSQEWSTHLRADEVVAVLADSFIAVPSGQWRSQPDGSWLFSVRRAPTWAVLLGLLTLPLGLLLMLLVKETGDLHIRVSAEPGGARVRATGRTPESTLAALDSWLSRMAPHARV